MFEKISSDPYILSIYSEIDRYDDQYAYLKHGISHINNVVDIVNKILTQLEFDLFTIECAKIATFLHGIGRKSITDDYSLRSFEMAQDYFIHNKIDTNNNNEILEAIKYHTKDVDSNFIAEVIKFANKLDVTHKRLTKSGKKIKGMRQFNFFNDLIIIINNSNITIMFLIDEKADKDELEKYYYTQELFIAIKVFAKKINRAPLIYYNNLEWNIEKITLQK